MRKLFTIIIYTLLVLIIGRNLSGLPRFYLFSSPQEEKDRFVTLLKDQTKRQLAGAAGNYGIYYADITTGQQFGINEKQIFTAASVNKVPIVAVLYHLDHTKKIDLDETLTLQAKDIQDYGTGSLRYKKPGGIYSLKTLAKLSLQESDNTAAYILAQRIGVPVIQRTITSWGLTQTDMANNKTSAYDMYLLYKRIYELKVTNLAKTQELLGFMIDTDIEDRLPARLPQDTNVYHKTGDATGSLHDVGIVNKEKTVFFLGILTSDIGNQETATKERIGDIAKSIYDSHQKKE